MSRIYLATTPRWPQTLRVDSRLPLLETRSVHLVHDLERKHHRKLLIKKEIIYIYYREVYLSKKEFYLFMAGGDLKDWSRSLHEVRGSGSASRVRLNTTRLEEDGWKIVSRVCGNRVHLTYVDPEGHKYKSSKDVERKLEADGILNRFLNENSRKIFDKQVSTTKTRVR